MARDSQIQMRRDTAANWTSVNPTLAAGEIGFETDTYYVKVGDGSSTWNNLPYASAQFASSYGSSGNWWFPQNGTTVGATLIVNTMFLAPIYLPKQVSIQAVAINISSATATSLVRLGLYSHDPTTGRPKLSTAPLFDWGTVSGAATGVQTITGLSSTLPGGWSWIAYVAQTAAPNVTTINAYPASNVIVNTNSTTAPAALDFSATRGGYTVSSVTGALPSITTLSNNNPLPIKIAFKTT